MWAMVSDTSAHPSILLGSVSRRKTVLDINSQLNADETAAAAVGFPASSAAPVT